MSYKLISLDISDKKEGHFVVNGVRFYFKRSNSQKSEPIGDLLFNVSHWTAGSPLTVYDDYHFNITEYDNVVYVFKTLKWSEKGQHLWGRNSNAIGYALCCMRTPKNTPTLNMLDALSTLKAETCAWKKIEPSKSIDLPKKKYTRLDHRLALVDAPGKLVTPAITDHSFFGDNDGYGNIDIKGHIGWVRKEALRVFSELKSGKRQFKFLELLKAK